MYFPLGGKKGSKLFQIRNLFVVFLISGVWHDLKWTFVFWGGINAVYFVPYILFPSLQIKKKDDPADHQLIPSIRQFTQMVLTFVLVMFSRIFYRSENISQAWGMIKSIFSLSMFEQPEIFPSYFILLIFVFLLIEWCGRKERFAFNIVKCLPNRIARFTTYYLMIFMIFYLGGVQQKFIYFQF